MEKDATCQRCGEESRDLRTLWMACLYKMEELGLPFAAVIRDGTPMYSLRVCKDCRADWMEAIKGWFDGKAWRHDVMPCAAGAPRGRTVPDVVLKVLAEIPEKYKDLRIRLSRASHESYRFAPEDQRRSWAEVSSALQALPWPPETPWQARVADIVRGPAGFGIFVRRGTEIIEVSHEQWMAENPGRMPVITTPENEENP